MPAWKKTHYTEADWIDFARSLAAPESQTGMAAHLRSGCAECRAMCDFARTMATFATEEEQYVVPESLVAAARSLFRPAPAPSWLDSLERIVAELVPGLPLEAQMAGVRSAGGGAAMAFAPSFQRLVYRAGDYGIDLSVEPCPDSGLRAITGQLAHQGGESLDGALVQIWVDGSPAAETRANPFGEFVAEFESGLAVELRIGLLVSGRRLDVSLPVVQ